MIKAASIMARTIFGLVANSTAFETEALAHRAGSLVRLSGRWSLRSTSAWP